MKSLISAAKAALAVVSISLCTAAPVRAGIPVIDPSNLTQSIITAIESVTQTLKQIEQYQTQLHQYENQLQNSLAPASFVWDQAQATVSGLMNATNTLNYYKTQLGSIDAYLGKFQDVAYYRNSPCYSSTGCSQAEWAAMQKNRSLAAESQKKANDALFRGIDKQQSNLQTDAITLQRLQSNAQGAAGQMEAIGYATQLASQQAHQLLQIRGLLLAQQNAVATRMQAEADKEAQTTAADEQFRSGSYKPSTGRNW
jgi:type IV secretion system protein TrbJ